MRTFTTLLATLGLAAASVVAMTTPASAAGSCTLAKPTLTPSTLIIDKDWSGADVTVAIKGTQCDSAWVQEHTLTWYTCGEFECWGSVPMKRSGSAPTYTWTSVEPINEFAEAGTYENGVWVVDGTDWMQDPFTGTRGPDLKILRASRLTANATPEPIKKNKTLTVKGNLSRVQWDPSGSQPSPDTYKGYANRRVDLQFRTPTGGYAKVKTVTTNSKGNLTTTVKATRDGCYRWVFTGSSTTAAVKSKGDCVDVT